MSEEDIVRRLEQLRLEMDALGQEMKRSSRDRMRSSMDGAIMDALSGSGRDRLEKDILRMRRVTTCANRDLCLDTVSKVASEATALYVAGDIDGALVMIAAVEENIKGIASPCGDEDCSDDCLRLMDDVRERIALSEKIRTAADGRPEPERLQVSAQDVFRSLDPLSHPVRVDILMILSDGDLSFTEIGRKVNLRTGHLQYHMKSLVDAGYVSRKVSRGPFSLTKQGSIALESGMEMARRLRT
jgi:DNA-binding transcriptional ArsR family regulator